MTKHTHHEIGDHAACIRLVPIFNHLEDSAMNYIAEKAHTKQYQKGEFLFRSQEKEDTLYLSLIHFIYYQSWENPYLSIGRLWQRAASADLEPW